jgi:hypothetical protein
MLSAYGDVADVHGLARVDFEAEPIGFLDSDRDSHRPWIRFVGGDSPELNRERHSQDDLRSVRRCCRHTPLDYGAIFELRMAGRIEPASGRRPRFDLWGFGLWHGLFLVFLFLRATKPVLLIIAQGEVSGADRNV